MSPGLSRYAWSACSTKMVSIFRLNKEKNRESGEGVSQAPDQPFPGKTAKSASPVASPGQGLCLPVHVSHHAWGCGSGAATLSQVTDSISLNSLRNSAVSFSASKAPIRPDSRTICSDSGTSADSFANPAESVLERIARNEELK